MYGLRGRGRLAREGCLHQRCQNNHEDKSEKLHEDTCEPSENLIIRLQTRRESFQLRGDSRLLPQRTRRPQRKAGTAGKTRWKRIYWPSPLSILPATLIPLRPLTYFETPR